MYIGEVDIEATTKIQQLQKRKVALEKRKAIEKIQSEKMTKAKSMAKTNLKLSTEDTDTGDEAAEESICKMTTILIPRNMTWIQIAQILQRFVK